MELKPVGRVANPEELDLDPIVIPVVGYTLERVEVVEKFSFRPVQPAGAAMEVLRQSNPNGGVPIASVTRYLDACLLDEGEMQRWMEYLERSDLMIEQGVLVDIYRALTEVYGARPTLPSSDSDTGGSSIDPTSTDGALSEA